MFLSDNDFSHLVCDFRTFLLLGERFNNLCQFMKKIKMITRLSPLLQFAVQFRRLHSSLHLCFDTHTDHCCVCGLNSVCGHVRY